jgi:progressive ankylosis protein
LSAVEIVDNQSPASGSPLSQSTIFRFFSPLALSWIFMSIEAPLSVALISRLGDAEVSTAAFQIMMGLALWIESPIIDLLSTSTTLAKTRQNYVELSRFVWWLIGAVTLVHAVLVFTPIYTVITLDLMGVPPHVAEKARLGLAAMLPWSALIGWRRYLQGILIRNGKTKLVGVGTAVRVVTMFVSAFLLYVTVKLPSIQIAAISLINAVGAEALFAHIASRDTIRRQFTHEDGGAPLTSSKLRSFHLPLTATTMVTMLGTPVVSTALAHTSDSVLQLAGYQVALTLVWLMRTTVYALPEVVITLYKDEASAAALRRFCIRLGIVTSGTMAVIWMTGLDKLFFGQVLKATPAEVSIAHIAFIAALFTPLVGAVQSYVRGMLTAHHLTVSRLLAVGISMSTLVVSLVVAQLLGVAGVIAAGVSLTIAFLAELGVLVLAWQRRNVRFNATV